MGTKDWAKRIWISGIAILLGSFVVATGEVLAKERVLTIGDNSAINNLDPSGSTHGLFATFNRNIYMGLVRFKFNSPELEGDLAESWAVSKNGLVYTFKLKKNIQFHKGFGKVTAHDVKFSFDRVMDPKTASPYMGELTEDVKEVKVVDDFTVEIHLKGRRAPFLNKCARPRPAGIVSKKAVEKYGKDFARNPIGSGPFVFQSMDREQLVLTANKDYYGGPPWLDKIIYKAIFDDNTRAMALEKGDIDISIYGFDEKSIVNRLMAAGCKITIINRESSEQLFLNPQFKPFADIRVRRAIAHAIDKDAIINNLLSGKEDRLDSLVPKWTFGHTEEGLRRYEFDPKKAKELLAEAGYPNGFEVTMDTSTSVFLLPVATALQDQLKKVGIKVNLAVTDHPTFSKAMRQGEFKMCPFVSSGLPDADFHLTRYFHSAGFSPGLNITRYNKLDKEIDEARSELNPAKRLKLYHEIQKRLMVDLPCIPLFMRNYAAAHRPHIEGLPNRGPALGFDFNRIRFVGEK